MNMARCLDLKLCIVCRKDYTKTMLGKSLFGYRHTNLENPLFHPGVLFKMCKECRRKTTLSETIKILTNMPEDDFVIMPDLT